MRGALEVLVHCLFADQLIQRLCLELIHREVEIGESQLCNVRGIAGGHLIADAGNGVSGRVGAVSSRLLRGDGDVRMLFGEVCEQAVERVRPRTRQSVVVALEDDRDLLVVRQFGNG